MRGNPHRHPGDLAQAVRLWGWRLLGASVWGFAFGVLLDRLPHDSPAGAAFSLAVFVLAGGLAWRGPRPQPRRRAQPDGRKAG